MADDGGRTEADRELDRWLHGEVDVRAPDRLLEDVFVRTAGARQVHGGWLVRLGTLGRRRGSNELGVRLRRGLIGLTAVLVVGLVGATIGPRLGSSTGAVPASRAPTPSAGGGPSPNLVVERSHATCARRGSLFVLSDTAAVGHTAWVTCGADSDEVLLGTDTVTARSGRDRFA